MDERMGTVSCDLQYSGAAFAALLAACAGAVALVLALPLSPALRAGLSLYAVAQAARAARQLTRPRALALEHDGTIEVFEGAHWRAGRVRAGSFVMPWLVIVRWRPGGARLDRTLLLLPGMAPPRAMRNIRVILRWGQE
jgi:hypothetical protein